MDWIKIMADQTVSKMKTRLTSDLFSKYGDNSKYVFSTFKKDDSLLKKLKEETDFDVITAVYEKIQWFKDLNFIKKYNTQEKVETDQNNQEIFSFVTTAVEYLESKWITKSNIKAHFIGFSDIKKMNTILENEYVINKIDNSLLETISKNIELINSKINELSLEEWLEWLKAIKWELKTVLLSSWLFDETTLLPTESFYDDIFSNKIDLMSIYRICSICDIEDFTTERNWKTFFYKNWFLTNKWYNVVTDLLLSDFKSVRSFDWMILWFTTLKSKFVLEELSKVSWNYRNNALRIPADTTDKFEKLVWKVNPIIDLFFIFKWLKYRELWSNYVKNRIFDLPEEKRNDIIKEKTLDYITDLKKYEWNTNFYNTEYIHNNPEFQKRIFDKFTEKGNITYKEFLYFCNYWLDKAIPPKKHNINYVNGNWEEIMKDIKKYDKIIIADFETTCLNEFKDGDILTMSYKMMDKKGNLIREKSYYMDHYKKNVTEWALWAFDYEDYKIQEKISREKFVNWIKTLIDDKTLFVFHNWYNFDMEILKSNFADIGETIDKMNVLDTIHMFREYYKSLKDVNYDIYAYSLDALSPKFWVENNRDGENHRSEEDVQILSDLFFTLILDKEEDSIENPPY